MMIKKFILPVFALAIFFTACQKEENLITASGELIDSGPAAADGSGFFIRLDNNEELKPDCLPDTLEIPHLRVRVSLTYQYTNRQYPSASCSICPGLPIVHIISIRKI